jgi:hypothetical protein
MYYSILIQTHQTLSLPEQYPLSILPVPPEVPINDRSIFWKEQVVTFDVLITDNPKTLEVLWDGSKVVTNHNFETSSEGVYVIGSLVQSTLSTQEQLNRVLDALL